MTVSPLYIEANDNTINPEYLEFCKEHPEMAKEFTVTNTMLFRRCMDTRPGNPKDSRRTSANFLWFMRFEKSFKDSEARSIKPQPPQLTIIGD